MYNNELFNKLEAWGADIENSLGRFMDNEALYIKFIMKFLVIQYLKQTKK